MKNFYGIIVLVAALMFTLSGVSQNRFRVFLSDKEGTQFNPYEYFDSKAIERRLKTGQNLYDIKDFPVKTDYIDIIGEIAEITSIIRWYNLLYVEADAEQLKLISELDFVERVEPVNLSTYETGVKYDTFLSDDDIELLENQTKRLGIESFHNAGFKGEGIRIAIFDGGFPGVDESPIFEHIRANNRIIATYDFAREKENVYANNVHGTMVLSLLPVLQTQNRWDLQ